MGNAKLTPTAGLAVLGLLLERTGYGYDLFDRFERSFSDPPWEWRVTSQAIYGALNRLENAGLIEPIDVEADRPARSGQRSARQNYRATGVGARAMREWASTPMPSNPSQKEVLLRLRFGCANDDALREMLRGHADECLAELERIAKLPDMTRIQRLAKEDLRLAVQARLSWIDFALAELRGPEDQRVRPVEP